jgi:hypothetical protein
MCFVLTDSWSNGTDAGVIVAPWVACAATVASFVSVVLLHSPQKLQTKPKVLTLTHDLPFVQANPPVSLIHCLNH